MKLATPNFIMKLIDKYTNNQKYTQEELDDFYILDDSNVYICCSNQTGDCWVEQFYRLESVFLYFNSDTPIEDIYKYDSKGYSKAPKTIKKLLYNWN
jgi:hypothetical protein